MNVLVKPVRTGGLAVAMVMGLFAWTLLFPADDALAHEGHAGPKVEFIKTNDALKAMLPEGAKTTRRKQEVTAEDAAWAKENLGVAVAPGIYPFFLARDAETGAVIGAAMTTEEKIGHGDLALGLGIDADGKVTLAAVLSVHRKYVAEVVKAAGKGVIKGLSGLTVADLSAKVAAAEGDTAKSVYTRLRDMAAVLVTMAHKAAE